MNFGVILTRNWWRANWSGILDLLRLIIVSLIVFAIWWGAWAWIDTNVLPSDSNETSAQARGLFGDKFGAVNSLFQDLRLQE